jgi:hypothetical protein
MGLYFAAIVDLFPFLRFLTYLYCVSSELSCTLFIMNRFVYDTTFFLSLHFINLIYGAAIHAMLL